jgi:hypothetical protein
MIDRQWNSLPPPVVLSKMIRQITSRNLFPMVGRAGRSMAALSLPSRSIFVDSDNMSSLYSPHLKTSKERRRFKSSLQTNALASWQKTCWTTYLASSLGSDNLFRSIDANHDNFISADEIRQFLDAVERKGVHPRAFKMLDELAHDHVMSKAEFKSWLILATKFGNDRNSALHHDYTRYPEVGERCQDRSEVLDDYRSWNELTMSQSVRRMQYAVRGQIVMRADEVSR